MDANVSQFNHAETYVAETNFASQKQNMFLPQVKNIFAARRPILLPKHIFSSLVTMEAMLTITKFCPKLLPRFYFDYAHAWHFISKTMFPRLATRGVSKNFFIVSKSLAYNIH